MNKEQKMAIIAIKNGKGGCGKTTATISIASILATTYQKRILVIDTDGRGQTTNMFATAEIDKQIGDVLLNRVNLKECIYPTRFTNIDLIGCGEEIKDDLKELEKNIFMDPMHRLGLILNDPSIYSEYDYCLIDCSQDADLMAVNIMLCADRIFIPARSDDYSKDGIMKMLSWIDQTSPARETPLDFKVFISDRERNKENTETILELQSLLQNRLCETTIRHQAKPVQYSIKTDIRMPFVLAKKQTGVAEDYQLLVKELFANEKF